MTQTKTQTSVKPYELGDLGYVNLIDYMGSDLDIVETARVTTRSKTDSDPKATEKLIRYLMMHEHSSPFEFAVIHLEVQAPIFVARQWFRHRSFSYNEISGRYSKMDLGIYRPQYWRGQSKSNRQQSEGKVEYSPLVFYNNTGLTGKAEAAANEEYKARLTKGVAREQARTCLPLSTITKFRVIGNLRNWYHFLHLRMAPEAQREIRMYATAISDLLFSLFPMSTRAFKDYVLNAVRLSGPEVGALQNGSMLVTDSKSEKEEWYRKLKILGRDTPTVSKRVPAEGAD